MKNFKVTKLTSAILSAGLLAATLASTTFAGPHEQAKRIHDRLAGVPPTEAVLDQMVDAINGVGGQTSLDAARIAMDNEGFYSGTLKRMAAPWTNRDLDPYVELDDYIATFIGFVLDDRDIRGILSDDWIYHAPSVSSTPYSLTSNAHYQQLENSGASLRDSLVGTTQTSLNGGIPAAGIMTTRSAAEAFFVLGTNRAMLRFTLMNHLCIDLEQMEDTDEGDTSRIRQDISRSPGGSSDLFTDGCAGCHIGMDPMAQAFAYYNWDLELTTPTLDYNFNPEFNAVLEQYNPGLASYDTQVQPKYHINGANFNPGYVTLDDSWDNFWREGINKNLHWDWGGNSPGGSGQGAATMGQELANSYAFAQCQVKKVFKAVCLRDPVDDADQDRVLQMTLDLRDQQGFGLRDTFAKAADHCKGN